MGILMARRGRYDSTSSSIFSIDSGYIERPLSPSQVSDSSGYSSATPCSQVDETLTCDDDLESLGDFSDDEEDDEFTDEDSEDEGVQEDFLSNLLSAGMSVKVAPANHK